MLTAKPRLPIKEIILFGFWPSFIKRILYRLRGYKIGRGVSIAFGAVLSGGEVSIGDHTSIGFFSVVRGSTVRIGSHVQIGATTFLDTAHLEIGDGTKINEQVFVGGLQFPDSRLIVGRNCQIMQMTFINPAREIRIGDDSGIGGDCLLFGHNSWLSKFDGYPVEFDSIEIGRSVSLAWRVFVLPGTKIGDGAVIGANSLVRGVIPGRCLAIGFPARVVSKEPEFPRVVADDEKRQILAEMIAEMLTFLRGSGFACDERDGCIEVRPTRTRRAPWRLRVADQPLSAAMIDHWTHPVDAFVSLHEIPTDVRAALDRGSVVWLDIARKERADRSNPLGEEVVQYLRRYGVRLTRITATTSTSA